MVVPPNHPYFNRVFHNKPSILGYPYFWKHPSVWSRNSLWWWGQYLLHWNLAVSGSRMGQWIFCRQGGRARGRRYGSVGSCGAANFVCDFPFERFFLLKVIGKKTTSNKAFQVFIVKSRLLQISIKEIHIGKLTHCTWTWGPPKARGDSDLGKPHFQVPCLLSGYSE